MISAHSAVMAAPLDVAAAMASVSHAGAGAVAVFVGQVRDSDPGAPAPVVALEYSAHPEAEAVLARIAADTEAGQSDARVAIYHRIGRLEVGEAALVACVSTPHRAAAFDLCRRLVEAVKAELPVWKRQVYADGTSTWVNCA